MKARKHNITHVKLCNGKLKTRSPYRKVAEKVDVMYWKTDNKGVLSIIMAAGEEGWEIYRDPRQKGERAKCYRTSDQKRFVFPTPKNTILIIYLSILYQGRFAQLHAYVT